MPIGPTIAALILATALAIAFFPSAFGLSVSTARAAALCLAAIGFWGTGAIPEYLTAILFFLFGMLFSVAPPAVIFAGFASTAWWLVVGGLVIGIAVKRTGLGDWLAGHLVNLIGGGYLGLITGVVVVGVVLAFLMPSTLSRVMIMIPIILAVSERAGFGSGSKGRDGMVLAAVLGTFVPSSAILPSNVANMVLAGAAETIHGVTLRYGSYLVLHFPVIGFLKAVLILILTWSLFRDRPSRNLEAGADISPLGRDGRRVGLVLIGALLLWATDTWHGINPAWIAVGAAVLCLMPGFGPVRPQDFNSGMNAGSMFYVAGVLGMGATLAGQGVADILGQVVLDLVPLDPGRPFWNYVLLSGAASLLGLGTAVPGIPAVMTPLAADLAAASGFSLMAVLMIIVIGFSTLLLPYQLPPMIIAMQLAEIRRKDAARLTLLVAVIGFIVFTPINYLWWRFLGYL